MIKTLIFFRNDDVRGTLDTPLVQITEKFIKHKIPLTHAVEPGNVSSQVVRWLNELKYKYPDLIEIIQHGYNHSCRNISRKGEFGGQQNYEEQFQAIKKGREMMDHYFGDLWFPAFCFPNGTYNKCTMKAVADNGFKVVNGGWEIDIKHQLFYLVTHLMHKELLFDKKVPYNLNYRPGNRLFQINVNISFIGKYLDEETSCNMLPLEKLRSETQRFKNQKTIGILLHHRYHNTPEKIQLVDDFLNWIKNLSQLQFATIEGIYNIYAAK